MTFADRQGPSHVKFDKSMPIRELSTTSWSIKRIKGLGALFFHVVSRDCFFLSTFSNPFRRSRSHRESHYPRLPTHGSGSGTAEPPNSSRARATHADPRKDVHFQAPLMHAGPHLPATARVSARPGVSAVGRGVHAGSLLQAEARPKRSVAPSGNPSPGPVRLARRVRRVGGMAPSLGYRECVDVDDVVC